MREIWDRVLTLEMTAGVRHAFDELGTRDRNEAGARACAVHYVETMRDASALLAQPWHESHGRLVKLMDERVENEAWEGQTTRYVLPSFGALSRNAPRGRKCCAEARLIPSAGGPS